VRIYNNTPKQSKNSAKSLKRIRLGLHSHLRQHQYRTLLELDQVGISSVLHLAHRLVVVKMDDIRADKGTIDDMIRAEGTGSRMIGDMRLRSGTEIGIGTETETATERKRETRSQRRLERTINRPGYLYEVLVEVVGHRQISAQDAERMIERLNGASDVCNDMTK